MLHKEKIQKKKKRQIIIIYVVMGYDSFEPKLLLPSIYFIRNLYYFETKSQSLYMYL